MASQPQRTATVCGAHEASLNRNVAQARSALRYPIHVRVRLSLLLRLRVQESNAGTVELQLSPLNSSATSVVVVGQLSGVTGVADLVDMLSDEMVDMPTIEN